MTLTLTLMIEDSGPFSHRAMFRFSKLKLIGLGGLTSLTFLLTAQLAEGGRPNLLIHGRYLRYIYLVRKVLTSNTITLKIRFPVS